MTSRQAPVELLEGAREHAVFVRDLSAEAFARFGDYDATLPPLLALPWIRTYVAVSEHLPVGFAICSLENVVIGEVELLAIAVRAEWQSQGVARRLLARVEELARERIESPLAAVRLTVAEDNDRARRVFERFGFTRVAGEPGHYPGGQRSLEMIKRLERSASNATRRA